MHILANCPRRKRRMRNMQRTPPRVLGWKISLIALRS